MSAIFLILLITISIYPIIVTESNENTYFPLSSVFDKKTPLNNYRANCYYMDYQEFIYYDLTDLKYDTKDNETSSSYPENQDENNDNTIQTNKMILFYNFCRNIASKCNNTDSLVTAFYRDKSCQSFTKSKENLKEWNFNGNNSTFLHLRTESDIPCTEEKNYSIFFDFRCDHSMQEGTFKLDNNNYVISIDKQFQEGGSVDDFMDYCEKRINFVSKNACQKKLHYSLWKFYLDNVHIFGLYIIISGFITASYGYKKEHLTIYIYSIFSILYLVYCLNNLEIFNYFSQSDYVLWSFTILEVFVGILIGKILNKYEKLKVMFYGGFTGICLFCILYYLLLGKLHFFTLTYYYLSALIMSVLFSILSVCFFQKYFAIIFSSSVGGGFLIIKVKYFPYFHLGNLYVCWRPAV